MAAQIINPVKKFSGKSAVPGDKSISHRALIFGALALGRTEVLDILESEDVQSTARCLRALGVSIEKKGRLTQVEGVGMRGFKRSQHVLDCGNSGTTMRLLMGLLAGQNFSAELSGDSSLVKRPMKRVAEPLELMGAKFSLTNSNYAPLTVMGSKLNPVDYPLKVASAQIKTAIILAALLADGTSHITGEIHSRDHTERMLSQFGVQIEVSPYSISILGGQSLQASQVQVPGDPSTAAFWMAAASLIEDGFIDLENISLNPTRTGFMRALQRMGANLKIETTHPGSEPVGRVQVRGAKLRGIHVTANEVPSLIDEIPMLAVLASQATGETRVEGADELRVKESDRLEAVAKNLRAMGAKIEVLPDGFVISGPQELTGATIETFHDHRIAMAFSIAGLVAKGPTTIEGSECVGISYPAFYSTLSELTHA